MAGPSRIRLRAHFGRTGAALLGVFLTACGLGLQPALAWTEPGGPNEHTADLATPNTHGWILQQAIAILERDGHLAAAQAARNQLQQIMNGLRAADLADGQFNIEARVGCEVVYSGTHDKSSLTHFYDWGHARNQGLRGLYISDINDAFPEVIVSMFSGSSTADILRGPHPDAASVADWHYASAVKARRQGYAARAYYELGIALHVVQDLAFPHHSRNQLQNGHGDFEDEANILVINRLVQPFPTIVGAPQGDYRDDLLASGFVMRAASQSFYAYDDIRSSNFGVRVQTHSSCLFIASRLTAGLLRKFYNRWATEPYSAVCLRVNHVNALRNFEWGEATAAGGADWKAYVGVNSDDLSQWFSPHEGGSAAQFPIINGVSDCYPNWLVDCWMLPAYVGAQNVVRISFSVFDDDDGATNPDDRADINPSTLTSNMYVRYDLANHRAQILHRETGLEPSWLPALPASTANPAVFTVRGSDCEVTFEIESIYVPAMAIALPPSPML